VNYVGLKTQCFDRQRYGFWNEMASLKGELNPMAPPY
jgi:hypothetical protein